MYAVEVSDQIMIAHSFRGEIFGPAQGVHGATFVIRVAFLADELYAHGIVVDIARAHDALKAALTPLPPDAANPAGPPKPATRPSGGSRLQGRGPSRRDPPAARRRRTPV